MHRLSQIATGFAGCCSDPVSLGVVAAGIGSVASSVGPTLATIGSVAGTATSVAGGIMKSRAQKSAGNANMLEAIADAQNATAAGTAGLADSQRAMEQQQRRTALTQSSLQARAAATGGDTSDPSVVRDAGEIQRSGDFNALADLATGLTRQKAGQAQASMDIYRGEVGLTAARVSSCATAVAPQIAVAG